MRKLIIISVLALLIFPILSAQVSEKELGLNAITVDALKAQTEFLASDWTEGRETGSKGEYMSADYIASMLQLFGVQPGGDYKIERNRATGKINRKRTYFQNFSLMTSSPGEEQTLSITFSENGASKSIEFEHGSDFIINASYPGGSVEGDVVFVGYGYIDEKSGYNDFNGIDVKGKVILRLSGIPAGNSSGNAYSVHRASMRKDSYPISAGAAAILEVDPSNIDGANWTPEPDFLNASPSERGSSRKRVRYSLPTDRISSFVPKANISLKVANTILKGSGIDLLKFANGESKSRISQKGFDRKVAIRTSVNSSFVKVRNVVGVIEGENKDDVILIGAHYDHLGIYNGYIYNGADDNASGTVGVMTIARAIAATGVKPEKTIVFALWTGEEKGLLGSKYYTENPTVPLEDIRINLNFDMISRYINDDEPNKVTMMYSPACPELKDMTVRNIKEYNIKLEPIFLDTNSPPGGTDHWSFINKGIPYLRYKTGNRMEYHSPADEVSTLDWDIMEKVVKLSFLNIWEMAGKEW